MARKFLRILILLIIGVASYFLFQIRQLRCEIKDGYLEDGVCQEIQSYFQGKSLFFTDFANASIWQQLAEQERYRQSYQLLAVQKKLFQQVTLQISSQLPAYRLVTVNNEQFVVGENNKVKTDQENLPLITIQYLDSTPLVEHGYVKADQHQAFLALVTAMKQFSIQATQVKWLNDQEIQIPIGNITVFVVDDGNFALQMQKLALVLDDETVKNELSTKHTLDLRFQLPVLK